MLAEQFDAFLLDLDGVVYIGAELLPGAAEALGRLRAAGKAIRFLTNDPRPTRIELAERLAGLGVEARADEVITCGWATAEFLRREGMRSVFVVGSAGLRAELEQAGIAVVDRERPEAVVVGADEHLGYLDILRASRLIHQGARFVAVNVDGAFPIPGGLAPATGAVVSAVQAATGRRPVVVGKPYLPMFELALASLPDRERVVMVGDNPESDILGAHQAGIPAILVADEPTAGLDPATAQEVKQLIRYLLSKALTMSLLAGTLLRVVGYEALCWGAAAIIMLSVPFALAIKVHVAPAPQPASAAAE